MKPKSNTVPAVVLAVGLVALVAAVVVSFIPFPHTGSPTPTAAFAAQQRLDTVAFKLGTSPGARYTGKLTSTSSGSSARTFDFKDLTVTSTKNAAGDVTYANNTAKYRQIGNYRWINGPSQLWTELFKGTSVLQYLDLAPTNNTWSELSFSGMPDFGQLLSPIALSGRIGNTERVKAPEPGLELAAPNKDLPDARYWPTSDPVITMNGTDKVQVGSMETAFDPENGTVTHIKGEFTDGATQYNLDTDVTPLSTDDLTQLFTDERALVPEVLSTPAPGIPLAGNRVSTGPGPGACTPASCDFVTTVSGAILPTFADSLKGLNGHVNFGLTVTFAVDNQPPGSSGGTCTRVVAVAYGAKATATCTATNLPSGNVVKPTTKYQYLPFRELTADTLTDYIDNQEKSSKSQIAMVRTGSKKEDAAKYNDQITGLPSSYGVQVGDYMFDGLGPDGNLFVAFAPGYDEHVTGTTLDPNWSGTTLLTDQLKKQLAASGDREITYFVAETRFADALRALALSQGADFEKLRVYPQAPTTD
ncbi:hypothetical protein AAFP30_18005 [Gordonia sp. CPCC 205515]|uniref:hypothetical protein n=1 Tax=Gordonia sp. CPCC 205515 TaxID=3140791 RepID=UPI003AF3FEEB